MNLNLKGGTPKGDAPLPKQIKRMAISTSHRGGITCPLGRVIIHMSLAISCCHLNVCRQVANLRVVAVVRTPTLRASFLLLLSSSSYTRFSMAASNPSPLPHAPFLRHPIPRGLCYPKPLQILACHISPPHLHSMSWPALCKQHLGNPLLVHPSHMPQPP